MKEEELKIVGKDNRVITLKELFESKRIARQGMANLSFEEKIRILTNLQKIASIWGGKKDIIVWQ